MSGALNKNIESGEIEVMSIARKLGTLVTFGIPAIIGGGIVYAIFDHSWAAVAVYEILLTFTAGAIVAK